MVMDSSKRDIPWVQRKLMKGLKTAVKFSKTEMAAYSSQLLIEWAKSGFICSPAGAMVSGAPGTAMGWGALVPCTGIPLVVCVNEPQANGTTFISVVPDHRAFDGKIARDIYSWLGYSIPKILQNGRL